MKKSGEIIELCDKGFTAVSCNENTPFKYATPDENGELWIFSSIIDEGSPVLFIGNDNPTNPGFRKEGEILLNRRTKYYILGEDIIDIKHTDGTMRKLHLVAIEYKW